MGLPGSTLDCSVCDKARAVQTITTIHLFHRDGPLPTIAELGAHCYGVGPLLNWHEEIKKYYQGGTFYVGLPIQDVLAHMPTPMTKEEDDAYVQRAAVAAIQHTLGRYSHLWDRAHAYTLMAETEYYISGIIRYKGDWYRKIVKRSRELIKLYVHGNQNDVLVELDNDQCEHMVPTADADRARRTLGWPSSTVAVLANMSEGDS